MDYNNPGREQASPPLHRKNNGFSVAAMTLAILSAIMFLFIYVSVPLGALAILFACLSRGNLRMNGRAKTAAVIAAIAMIVSSAATGYAAYRLYTDPELRETMQEMLDYYMQSYGGEEAISQPEDSSPDQSAPDKTDSYDYNPWSDFFGTMPGYGSYPQNNSSTGGGNTI